MLALVFLELTGREILQEIPHDFGALIVYSLLAALVAFTVYGSRPVRTPSKNEGEVGRRTEPEQ